MAGIVTAISSITTVLHPPCGAVAHEGSPGSYAFPLPVVFERQLILSRVPPIYFTVVVSPPAMTVSPHTRAACTRIFLLIESFGPNGCCRLCARLQCIRGEA